MFRVAAQTMESEKIGALIVVNPKDSEDMVGILTARDIQQAVAEFEETDLPTVKVQLSIYLPSVVWIGSETRCNNKQ